MFKNSKHYIYRDIFEQIACTKGATSNISVSVKRSFGLVVVW